MATKSKKKQNAERAKVMKSINKKDNEASSIIKTVVIVLVVICLVYFFTVYITKHSTDSVKKITREDTTIQYDEILAGTSFSKKDEEYLVLFYNVDDDNNSIYDEIKSNYEAKEESLPMYYVNLDNSLNKSCISKDSNKEATTAEELKINEATLIKFTNNKISEYITGETKIKDYLNK